MHGHSFAYGLCIMPVEEGRQIKEWALRYQMGENEATRQKTCIFLELTGMHVCV